MGLLPMSRKRPAVGAVGLYGQGVAVGDFDNDGYPDMLVTGYGHTILYHNNGTAPLPMSRPKQEWRTTAIGQRARDGSTNDKDGYLDLLICNYIQWTPKTNLWCGEHRPGYRAYCHPDNYRGERIKALSQQS